MSINDRDIVSDFLRQLASRIGNERFQVWFGPNPTVAWNDGALTIDVANPFTKDWIQSRFRNEIHEACSVTLGVPARVELRWQAASENSDDRKDKARPAANSSRSGQRNRHPAGDKRDGDAPCDAKQPRRALRTLDAFVAGTTNQVAWAAAKSIAHQPGNVSPLYLFGNPGLGKTHLLEGIISEVRKRFSRQVAVYLTAERFTCDFLEALKSGGLPGFRRKYRHVDVLLIDDVQFLEGKQATQNELQHTTNDLMRAGKQIVFAADRPPADLSWLGQELVSRMAGGMVCQIHSPDRATRLRIVERLARDRGVTLPNDVLDLIVTRISDDVRALQGALHTLLLHLQAFSLPVSLAMAENALQDVVDTAADNLSLQQIEQAVCQVCGVNAAKLQSGQRARAISHPRMLAMWLARKYTRAALSEIGDYFGGRSHSTVVAAQKRIDQWLRVEKGKGTFHGSCELRDTVRKVEQRLKFG